MNQQKSKNFQCNNIFELLLINKNYLFFHNTYKIRRPHKANLDMAGKILTWRENSAASQSKRAWNAPWNAPSPPRIFSCRHDDTRQKGKRHSSLFRKALKISSTNFLLHMHFKLRREINGHFLLNEHGDPHFLMHKFKRHPVDYNISQFKEKLNTLL